MSGYDALVTSSHDFVQRPEVVAALPRSVSDAHYKARRIAVVRASVPDQIQTKLIIEHDRTRIFAGIDEAKGWLLEAASEPIAPR